MARFLLIHGAAHGAWCWRDVLPALTALGHDAWAIDLPSHGDDATDPATVTLTDYGAAVRAALDAPTILVGHSMGGYAIAQAAAMDPNGITRLVYLCAYTPWPGQSLAQMRMQAKTQPLLPAIRAGADRRTFTFDSDLVTDRFYHDCPPETVAYALARLTPQATAPTATPVPAQGHTDLPQSYILCEHDRAVPPDFQRVMAMRFAPEDVFALPSGHSPFFSMPERLTKTLHTIATR